MAGLVHTGGCQCGAVRFRVTGALDDASICHCRMCQKAFGAYYAPLVSTRGAVLEWTRGAPRHFQSSNLVRRGFCADCGTGLFYTNEEIFPGQIDVQSATLDDPDLIPAGAQIQIAERIGWMEKLDEMPLFNRNPGMD